MIAPDRVDCTLPKRKIPAGVNMQGLSFRQTTTVAPTIGLLVLSKIQRVSC